MKAKRYTPASLIAAVERVRRKTPAKKCEGLMLAVGRMIHQHKPFPKKQRKIYKNKWAWVAIEVLRGKQRR